MASAQKVARPVTGVVVSAGKMAKTVKVRVPIQTYNGRIRKVSQTYPAAEVTVPRSSYPLSNSMVRQLIMEKDFQRPQKHSRLGYEFLSGGGRRRSTPAYLP